MTIVAAHVDMDGTLALSEPRNRAVIQSVAEEFNVPNDQDLWAKEFWPVLAGTPEPLIHAWLIEKFAELAAISGAEFQHRCRDGYEQRISEVEIRPEMLAFLEELKGQGTKVGLVTSSNRRAVDLTFELAFGSVAKGDAFFDSVLSSDDVPDQSLMKPHPYPYLTSCEKMYVSPARGQLALEDSGSGTKSALQAFKGSANHVFQFLDEGNAPIIGAHAVKTMTDIRGILNMPVPQTVMPKRAVDKRALG